MGSKISGFAFDGRGRLDRIDTFTTRNGKEIITLVLQVEGAYPQLVPIKFFGRMADEARVLTVGDVIEVTGRLGGRDWNGKVYPDIVGESIEVVAESSGTRGEQREMPGTGGAGQHRETRASDPLPTESGGHGWGAGAGSDDDDSIPF